MNLGLGFNALGSQTVSIVYRDCGVEVVGDGDGDGDGLGDADGDELGADCCGRVS